MSAETVRSVMDIVLIVAVTIDIILNCKIIKENELNYKVCTYLLNCWNKKDKDNS